MFVLASKSPRRIQMLTEAGLDPVVRPASIIEELPFPMAPETATMYLAMRKAQAVADACWQNVTEPITILAADTVVVYKGRIIGKPTDEEDAFNTLRELRGKSHHVITGCCLLKASTDSSCNQNVNITSKECFFQDTEVFFKHYTDEELRAYVKTEEPYDKAGGYAIQETFEKYVDHIEGDYDNVVGLPLTKVLSYL